RRNAQRRRRARDSVDSPAWDYPREHGSVARLKSRLAGHFEQSGLRASPRLFRRREAAQWRGTRNGHPAGSQKPVWQDFWTEGGMKLIDFFRRPRETAPVARERLQILLAHDRAVAGKSDLIAILREEILGVI